MQLTQRERKHLKALLRESEHRFRFDPKRQECGKRILEKIKQEEYCIKLANATKTWEE